MSCGTLGLTVAELYGRIKYPPIERPGSRIKPISTTASRQLLNDYKASVSDAGARRALMYSAVAQTSRPMSSTALVARYEKAIADDRPNDAIVCLLEAIRSGENSHDAFYNLALLKHQAGLHREAIDYYTKALDRDPMRTENYQNRAECYMALDDARGAFGEWVKLFKLVEPSKALLVKCGKCALDSELLDEAHRYLTMGLQRSDEDDKPTDAYAYFNLGELSERRGDDAAALSMFAKVCETDPDFPSPYLAQAEQELSNDNLTLALHLFEAVAKMLPTDASVFVRLADVYERLGTEFIPSVLDCLSRAISFNRPEDVLQLEMAFCRRGKLLFHHSGDLPNAESDFTRCLAVNPRNAEALMNRAAVYQARGLEGCVTAAAADYARVLQLAEVSWAGKYLPHLFLARVAFSEKDYIKAARYFSCAGTVHSLEKDGADQDLLQLLVSVAYLANHADVPGGPDFTEDHYEPRPGHFQTKDAEKGKKQAQESVRNFPHPSLSYLLADQVYSGLREQEPTAHSALEGQFLSEWKAVRDDVEKRRDEYEAQKGGKRGAGGAKKK